MKKIIALACTITCIFGLTACGGTVKYTEFEQQKIDDAKTIAAEEVLPFLEQFMDDANLDIYAENTAEEIEHLVAEEYGIEVDGNAVPNAITSFNNTADSVGSIVSIGEITAEIADDTIIVTVPVVGQLKNANAEMIFSNDIFLVLESAALNEESSLGDALIRAALNTLLGMGTVFIVLILISFIISLFAYIPKIQAWFSNRKKKDTEVESIDNTIAQIVEMEEVDATDDLELVAVIAAAIAASEGAASTDGFVVRSIRKVNRRK